MKTMLSCFISQLVGWMCAGGANSGPVRSLCSGRCCSPSKNVTYMSSSPLRTKCPIIQSTETFTAFTKCEETGLTPSLDTHTHRGYMWSLDQAYLNTHS